MPNEAESNGGSRKARSGTAANGAAGGVYGLGFIGALVYYIQTATGFWVGVVGVLKALVWPGFLVYEVMKYLHM